MIKALESIEPWEMVPNGKTEPTVFGIGVSDMGPVNSTAEGKQVMHPAYNAWKRLLSRAYCPKFKAKNLTYEGVTVCDEWLTFSNFYRWWQAMYVPGWDLDKDIRVPGNKMYSPEACAFIPRSLNTALVDSGAVRGELPQGVSLNGKGYRARCKDLSHPKRCWVSHTVPTVLEAAVMYANRKREVTERHLSELPKDHVYLTELISGARKIVNRQVLTAVREAKEFDLKTE